MLRRLTVSVLFLLGFLAVAGFAQPPAKDPKPAEKKAVDPLDALIGSALANDPDVKMAHAKIQLAEADLAKARQAVTLKVMALHASIQEQKRIVAAAQVRVDFVARLVATASTPQSELMDARDKFESAQAKLAQLETELKLLTGGTRVAGGGGWDFHKAHPIANWNAGCASCHQVPVGEKHDQLGEVVRSLIGRDRLLRELLQAPAGPISERIRAALDKPVRLGAKDAKVTLEQALEIFKKEAGLDVPVRVDAKITLIVSLGEELPVGAWLQLFADGTPETRILVREYGLLVTHKNLNPPDAISVFDFWKQKQEKKAAEPKP